MISEYWERIEMRWERGENAPTMLEDLNPGASEDEIAALESELGRAIPRDFRDSLKLHNGESDGWPCKAFADYGAYLGTDRILEIWKQRLEIAQDLSDEDMPDPDELIRDGIIQVEGPVRPEMYLAEWIPIMECNGDVFWALDMNPAEDGEPGQVIEVDWEGCSWKVVSDSFESFMRDYIVRLESGTYRIIEGQPTMES